MIIEVKCYWHSDQESPRLKSTFFKHSTGARVVGSTVLWRFPPRCEPVDVRRNLDSDAALIEALEDTARNLTPDQVDEAARRWGG